VTVLEGWAGLQNWFVYKTEFSADRMDYHSAEDLDGINSKRVTQYRLPVLTTMPSQEIAFRRHQLPVFIQCVRVCQENTFLNIGLSC
jgi:hypothetical protein